MSRTAAYWRAARPVAHGMIALPILVGQAWALVVLGQFSWPAFWLAQGFGVLTQVYVLYLNDFADEAVDRIGEGSWLSGGSRVVPEGALTGTQLFQAAGWAAAGMGAISLVALAIDRPGMILLCVIALGAGWTYSLAPIRASYSGYGELHQALSVGLLLPLLGYYLQAGELSTLPLIALLPMLILFYAANIVTAIPDLAADRAGGKQTYPVRRGLARARRDALLLCAASLVLAPLMLASWIDWRLALAWISLPALLLSLAAALAQRGQGLPGPGSLRFASLVMFAQGWMMCAMTGMLFWQAIHGTAQLANG